MLLFLNVKISERKESDSVCIKTAGGARIAKEVGRQTSLSLSPFSSRLRSAEGAFITKPPAISFKYGVNYIIYIFLAQILPKDMQEL